MPLHTRSLGAGPSFRALSPDPTVNIALTAGLFSIQPPIRIYAPYDYDRVSSVTLNRLGILVVAGGIIKTALSNYGDVVFMDSPWNLGLVMPEAAPASGFDVVGRGSNALKSRKRLKGDGKELAVSDALGNVSGDINALVNVSPGIGLHFFGPFLDISGVTIHNYQQVIKGAASGSVALISKERSSYLNFANIVAQGQCLDGTYDPLAYLNPLDVAFIPKEHSHYLDFANIIAQVQCLDGSAIEEPAMKNDFVHPIVALSIQEISSSSSVAIFSFPVSPFAHPSKTLQPQSETSGFHVLSIDEGQNSLKVVNQESFIDWRIYMLFGLLGLLGLSLKPRSCNESPVRRRIIRHHIPYDPLPKYDALKGQERFKALYALAGPRIEHLGACTSDPYIEVWWSQKTMDSVNNFIENNSRFVPEQSKDVFDIVGSFVLHVLLFGLEYIESLVLLVWLGRLHVGVDDLFRIVEIIAVFVVPREGIRYFRFKVIFRPFVKLKGRKKRRRGRRKRAVTRECFGTGPENIRNFSDDVSMDGPDALELCSTGPGDENLQGDIDQ